MKKSKFNLLNFSLFVTTIICISTAHAEGNNAVNYKSPLADQKSTSKVLNVGANTADISRVSNSKPTKFSKRSEKDSSINKRNSRIKHSTSHELNNSGQTNFPNKQSNHRVRNKPENFTRLHEVANVTNRMRQAQQMEQVNNAQQQLREFERNSNAMSDPATDTAFEGKGLGMEDRNMPELRGMRRSDCITNPADCVSQPENQPGRFSDSTYSGASAAGAPEDDGKASDATLVGQSFAGNLRTSSSSKSTYLNSDGTTTVVLMETSAGGLKSIETIATFDKEGNEIASEVTYRNGEEGIEETQHSEGKVNTEFRETGNDEAGQPSDSGWTNPNACNYNPITKQCQGARRVTHEDMTGQPSPIDDGTDTNDSSTPNVGAVAVTNPGGGDWVVDVNRNSNSRSKIDENVVDPEEMIPGGPLPEPGE